MACDTGDSSTRGFKIWSPDVGNAGTCFENKHPQEDGVYLIKKDATLDNCGTSCSVHGVLPWTDMAAWYTFLADDYANYEEWGKKGDSKSTLSCCYCFSTKFTGSLPLHHLLCTTITKLLSSYHCWKHVASTKNW